MEELLNLAKRITADVQAVCALNEELVAALVALYTYPGVRELLAPNGLFGSIADQVEAVLAKVMEDAAKGAHQ